MDELVTRIGFPMGRFTSAGYYHTRALAPGFFCFDCRSQVHQAGHRTKHALRMIDQTDQFPDAGLASQINGSFNSWVIIAVGPDLHKLDFATKVIYDLLVPLR